MTTHQGSITIGRVTSTHGDPYIQVSVQDETSRHHFIELTMSMEAFAMALTGMGAQPLTFDLRGVDYVGKRREIKDELVPRPPSVERTRQSEAAAIVLAPFETDGWVGRADDLWNHHKAVGCQQRVLFTRYVDNKESP